MEKLQEQFADALAHIEINVKRRELATHAHSEIRSHLEDDGKLRSWGIDTVLIGSYARHTGIHPGRDVDVFSKLARLDTTVNPTSVFGVVRDCLVAKYGQRAKPQHRSIKVKFGDDGDEFSVDVVPAVRMGTKWGIPNRDPKTWALADTRAWWVETDPEKLAELTSQMNKTVKVNGDGAYVPTVKLVRQIRCHHLGDRKPGGLYFELLTYHAFKAGVTGSSFAEILAATLAAIADQLNGNTNLLDPALGSPYAPAPTTVERSSAANTFTALAAQASAALAEKKCPAAAAWRAIIGRSNNRGWCFPLPPGCDEQGKEIKKITAVTATGSREASGFA